ncbi:MAG: DEAD/DEAH box helicase, partial [Candidatus Electrothrix sp. AUS1_2]|nr:DEAD/DEAH box helicase [Candidatus Electrothrix sp. AUS1_2]
MIKQFLIKAGRRLKRLAGSGAKKRQESSRSEQELPHSIEQQGRSDQKNAGSAAEQLRDSEKTEATPPPRKPRPTKPRWTPEQFPVDPVEGKTRFHDFSLPLGVMHAVADLDFKYCTPIQEKALPDAMAGKDIIGRAGTGTGKSAVFLIAVFARLISENKMSKQLRHAG